MADEYTLYNGVRVPAIGYGTYLTDKAITAFFDMLPHLCYIVPLTVVASIAFGFVTHYSVSMIYSLAEKTASAIAKRIESIHRKRLSDIAAT